MAQLKKKFIKLGTGTEELNSQDVPANFTPTNYTPTQVGSEGTDKTSAHLKGIDVELAGVLASSTGDIDETSFAGANNVAAAANVTGLAFANGTVRSFSAQVSVFVDAASDLYEVFDLKGIQRGADWVMSSPSTGDESLVNFTITTAGQVQYTSGNYTTFVSLEIKFRATVTSV